MHPARTIRRLGLALSFAPIALTPVLAAGPAATAQTFFAPDSTAPELANAYLMMHPGDALEISSFGDPANPMQILHAFGPVSRSRAGVCRFTATQVFAHRSDDGTISWDSKPSNPREHAEPPYTMAAVAGNPCPKQNDDAYASLDDGIMDREIIAISNFWKETSGSESKFDAASVYLSLIVSQRVADAFAAFRTALFQPGGKPPQMQAIFRAGVDGYDLAFGDGRSASSNFFLSISKSGTGFQVLNFQTQF
ncbi:MAG TPA: hypothetical protein VGM72_08540 [Micropepsaceae bacterium]|jgi:hypothetical protein